MGKHCILFIDMLNDFIGEKAALGCPDGEKIVPAMQNLLKFARSKSDEIHVVHVQEAHRKNDADFKIRPIHAIKGTWGSQVIDALKPLDDEYIVQKRRHSAFMYTDLDLYLREEKIDTVIVTGVWTNVCVRCSASDASYRAYKVIGLSDCCASKDEEMHKAGLRDMAIFAKVMTSEEYINDWNNGKDPWQDAGQPDNIEK